MKKNYVFYLFLFCFFIFCNGYSQTYKLDNGMVGRMPVTFNDGSFIKIQDSILLLNIHPTVSKLSVSEYKIVEDQVKKFEDREIRTLRLLSTTDVNLRIHGTIVTGETVRNTVSANAYDMSTQITTPYVMFIEK